MEIHRQDERTADICFNRLNGTFGTWNTWEGVKRDLKCSHETCYVTQQSKLGISDHKTFEKRIICGSNGIWVSEQVRAFRWKFEHFHNFGFSQEFPILTLSPPGPFKDLRRSVKKEIDKRDEKENKSLLITYVNHRQNNDGISQEFPTTSLMFRFWKLNIWKWFVSNFCRWRPRLFK